MLLGPLVHWALLLHRPLAHWGAAVQPLPLATPVAPCGFPEPEEKPLRLDPPHANAPTKLAESAIAASVE
jgi:hypothetical protein